MAAKVDKSSQSSQDDKFDVALHIKSGMLLERLAEYQLKNLLPTFKIQLNCPEELSIGSFCSGSVGASAILSAPRHFATVRICFQVRRLSGCVC